ncbi:MAG: lamin tail domain-containing protein [Chitinophagaceae bacterium]
MKVLLFLILLAPTLTFSQNRYDVVIDEIMADPTPLVGLPNNEWIELRNTTAASINLQGWRIADGSGQSGAMPNFTLQPDSMVIVCTSSAVAALSVFGNTISVTSFPSLDNDGETIFLKALNGKIIHAVSYTSAWYQNELKKDGGWTLEMIDTQSPCAGSNNWKASVSPTGGTPGKKNSIDGVNTDNTLPKIKNAYTVDNTTIMVVFDEPVDSISGATLSNYSIDGGLVLLNATTIAPLFNMVQIKTTIPLNINTVYTITVSGVKDCKGNTISNSSKVKTGLATDALAGDWILNEFLFNPKPNAYDYVELYNKSNKIFDASKLYIANRNSSGVISSIKPLSNVPWLVFPGDYIVATDDVASLTLNYLVLHQENVLTVSPMPSYPDDEGNIIALNFQGDVVDEVKYKDDWHFKLIDNAEGVALERIDANENSQNENNWHSAASTAGYGTPTYKNSQYKQIDAIDATIAITPKVFSPDNDGYNDVASIQYKITEPGYVANIVIYDAAGRPVRQLVRNGIMGLTGYWNWDGLNDKGSKLPTGTYLIFTEIFNLQGKKKQFKNTIVLARKL